MTCFLRLEDDSGQAAAQASGVQSPPVDGVTHGQVKDNDSALEEARQDGIQTADENPREALRQVGEDDSEGSKCNTLLNPTLSEESIELYDS